MKPAIAIHSENFPEPEFSALQRRVFADVQSESPELTRLLASEASARVSMPSNSLISHSPMVRFAAQMDGRLIGWSCGWMERGRRFYMANSGVLPEYRRSGVYTSLLKMALSYAGDHGAVAVRSQHSVLNNPVIICKLKNGFQISGLSVSAQMGMLVELTNHLSRERGELFRSRVVPFASTANDA